MDSPDTDPRRTILVAEDDPMVRRLATRSLERAGYHVLEASSGHDAAVVASLYDGAIDLLIADVILPGMSGVAVAKRVLRERPDMRVLFMTASPDTASVPAWAMERGLMLEKPFRLDDFVAKAAAVLHDDSRRPPEPLPP